MSKALSSRMALYLTSNYTNNTRFNFNMHKYHSHFWFGWIIDKILLVPFFKSPGSNTDIRCMWSKCTKGRIQPGYLSESYCRTYIYFNSTVAAISGNRNYRLRESYSIANIAEGNVKNWHINSITKSNKKLNPKLSSSTSAKLQLSKINNLNPKF